MPTEENGHVFRYAMAILLLVIVIGGGYFAYLVFAPHKVTYSNTKNVIGVLNQTNPDFLAGGTYAKQGDYKDALTSYQKALGEAKDVSQEGQIRYLVGRMQEQLGHYAEAIATFKSVAADTRYYPQIRAYAVQEIGAMHHTYYDALPLIATETFKDEPYASFKQDGNLEAAYTKLFEYAASIYPLSLSESFVAFGYLKDLRVRLKGATTTTEGIRDVEKIHAALDAVETDLPRLLANPNELPTAPDIYTREAVTITALVKLGVPGYTNEQVESLYMKAMQGMAASSRVPGNLIAWHYAVFLAQAYGKSRLTDIDRLLAAFTSKNAKNIEPTAAVFFKSIRNNPTLKLEDDATILLGQLDPSFKKYLISLGWHAADFASH